MVPEFELFDLGQVHALHRLLDRYGLPYGGKVHVDLVMGVPGGMPGTADALVAAVAELPAAATSWSATGIGRSTLPVALASLSKGGHLRVGMEDVLTLSRGVPVEHNAQLVERAVGRGPGGPARADDAGRGARAARARLTTPGATTPRPRSRWPTPRSPSAGSRRAWRGCARGATRPCAR